MNPSGLPDSYSAVLPAFNTIQSGEGEYIYRILATNEDGYTADSGLLRVPVMLRRPVISNITVIGTPAAGDTLLVGADIVCTSGNIIETKLLYRLNYNQSIYEVDMERHSGNTFHGYIPGQSAGTMVYISVWAKNDSLLTSIENKDADGREVRYVFPIEKSEATLRIKPKAYNIYESDKVEIGYFAQAGDLVIMRIYNSEGKLMATPLNRITSATSGVNFYEWNGRDKDFKLVEPGMYICHLEVIDRITGKKKTDKAPIVVGTRLR